MKSFGIVFSSMAFTVFACGGNKEVELPATVFGHCFFFDGPSDTTQCKELRGDGWDDASATEECQKNDVPYQSGPCDVPEDEQLGSCVLERDVGKVARVVVPGTDTGRCNSTKTGCEVFGRGDWQPATNCGGDVDLDDVYDNENYAIPPYETCSEPIDGGPGLSSDGKVCTLTLIGACTEEGRNFQDYASCDDVRTQQPYYPRAPNTEAPDERMQDPDYVSENEWVKSQVAACACACCHSDVAPDGTSIWSIDAEDNWVSTFTDFGLGFAAGRVDSSLLGSFGEGENNGFTRMLSGIPSNDEARMKAFFEAELSFRALEGEDFSEYGRIPAPFADQDDFVPLPCENGEGVDEQGRLFWEGGRARYIYILDEGTENPGVPPNRDLPSGTRWRVDTVPPATPMKTGEVVYGEVPSGASLVFPESGSPAALVSGSAYTIYIQSDLMLPSTRCVFVAP